MASGAFPPVMAREGARIVVVIKNDQPIDLLDFTASLTALAREHESSLRKSRPEIQLDETRLLVTDVRKGSILLELVPVLAPFVSNAEIVNTTVDFVKHMGSALNTLRVPGGRLPDATTQQLKNFADAVQAVAADSKGTLEMRAVHNDGSVLQQFTIRKTEAIEVQENAAAQRREIAQKAGATHEKVLMRLHQSSVADPKVNRRSAEKGIVERVDPFPHWLVYVSDMAGQRIKEEILRPGGNPYQKGFIVDLDVETVGGRPRLYRVLALHDVIDLDDT